MGRGAGGIVRRPAVPPPIRIRRNVLSLRADDPILVFYGRAIDKLKTRRISDFNSWRYQAAIHDYIRADDPNAVPGDLPLPADSTTFWSTCEHRNWFFLPWHRMYLHHFEMMCLHEVLDQGGPTDWALPYWNYSSGDANARLLPEAFRQGALFVRNRDANANAGLPFMRTGAADPTDISSLRETVFEGTAPEASAGFGGLRPTPPATKNHSGGNGSGRVERTPHDRMHGALSGDDRIPGTETLKPLAERGFMGSFTRAPLDPIFWVHHCNIDRLWEVWTRIPGNANPTSADFLDAVSFPFRDVNGQRVNMTSRQVVDTRAAPLFYIYDDIRNPLSP